MAHVRATLVQILKTSNILKPQTFYQHNIKGRKFICNFMLWAILKIYLHKHGELSWDCSPAQNMQFMFHIHRALL